jgi:hypothetical protein
MDGRSGMNITRRASSGAGWLTAWRRAAGWRAGLALAAGLLLLCGCPYVDSSYGYGFQDYFEMHGQATITGPLPVSSTYDGTSALTPNFQPGLFRPGTNVVASYMSFNRLYSETQDDNLNGQVAIYGQTFPDEISAGVYELAVYTTADPYLMPVPHGTQSGNILARGPNVTVDYGLDRVTIEPFELNFTGPAPYGSVSGRFLISGSSLYPMTTQLVLKPTQPIPGINPETGLLWQVGSADQHGQVWFTVPGLSYGGYELSYAGNGLHDRDDTAAYASLPITISATQPEVARVEFMVSNSWQPDPKYVLGSINGTLTLPADPAPDTVYCIETIWQNLPNTLDPWLEFIFRASRQIAAADDFDAEHKLNIHAERLEVGQYLVSVYRLTNTPGGQDELLGTFGPYELSSTKLELTGIAIEVTP